MAGIREAKIGRTLGYVGHAIEGVVEKIILRLRKICSTTASVAICTKTRRSSTSAVATMANRSRRGWSSRSSLMVCAGGGAVRILKDDSYASRDRSLAAHFEHTVAITKNGPRILTQL